MSDDTRDASNEVVVYARCCCGRVEVTDPEDRKYETIIINGRVHEELGPAENFCGPVYSHTIRDQQKLLEEATTAMDEAYHCPNKLKGDPLCTGCMNRLKEILDKLPDEYKSKV